MSMIDSARVLRNAIIEEIDRHVTELVTDPDVATHDKADIQIALHTINEQWKTTERSITMLQNAGALTPPGPERAGLGAIAKRVRHNLKILNLLYGPADEGSANPLEARR
jgi:hypothetical protein